MALTHDSPRNLYLLALLALAVLWYLAPHSGNHGQRGAAELVDLVRPDSVGVSRTRR